MKPLEIRHFVKNGKLFQDLSKNFVDRQNHIDDTRIIEHPNRLSFGAIPRGIDRENYDKIPYRPSVLGGRERVSISFLFPHHPDDSERMPAHA